ncbi:uncharacterized protein [Venturia canescens]|uniref:uncharacterized protein n=1 Tax=Venturia canescens TaxID=32260 RepID=UPI001C9CE1EE|nr:uncharacterized protein LOC122408779 [Venturia canescens]
MNIYNSGSNKCPFQSGSLKLTKKKGSATSTNPFSVEPSTTMRDIFLVILVWKANATAVGTNTLVTSFLQKAHRAISLPHGKMYSDENSYLLGKSGSGTVYVNISDSDVKKYRALSHEEYQYYEARPLWIKIRLCLFWLFWAAFFTVIIIFVLIYWCIAPNFCPNNVVYSV